MAFIGLLEDRGPDLPRTYGALLAEGIHELRIKLTGMQTRILYFFCYQRNIVLTNVFEKHSDQSAGSLHENGKRKPGRFLSRFTENDIRGKK
jgi:hypothetical protein